MLFFIISIKYPKSINTSSMVHITNHGHQLYRVNIFTDIVNIVKSTIYLPLIDLITKMMLTFIACRVNYDFIWTYPFLFFLMNLVFTAIPLNIYFPRIGLDDILLILYHLFIQGFFNGQSFELILFTYHFTSIYIKKSCCFS